MSRVKWQKVASKTDFILIYVGCYNYKDVLYDDDYTFTSIIDVPIIFFKLNSLMPQI